MELREIDGFHKEAIVLLFESITFGPPAGKKEIEV